jgi:hypothetical protein
MRHLMKKESMYNTQKNTGKKIEALPEQVQIVNL